MSTRIIGLLFMVVLATSPIQAQEINPDTTVVIDREISGETMAPVMSHMFKLIVAEEAPSDLQIILNSPGGSVLTGFQFVVQMKVLQAKGTKITCFVPSIAASMAFHIFLHCDKRMAPCSGHGYHGADDRTSTPITWSATRRS
jgi:ATP-dependent protease ClpP protease subunit